MKTLWAILRAKLVCWGNVLFDPEQTPRDPETEPSECVRLTGQLAKSTEYRSARRGD